MHVIVGLLFAASMSQAAAPAATGHLSGRIVAEGTGTPIAGALVMLFAIHRPSGPAARFVPAPVQGL